MSLPKNLYDVVTKCISDEIQEIKNPSRDIRRERWIQLTSQEPLDIIKQFIDQSRQISEHTHQRAQLHLDSPQDNKGPEILDEWLNKVAPRDQESDEWIQLPQE